MITSIKNADYSFLFQEASEELVRLHFDTTVKDFQLTQGELDYLLEEDKEKGGYKKDDKGNYIVHGFTSLEQYFTRLGSLVNYANNPIQYLMLPLDEPCLEVDANSRIIDIPNNFKKFGASVQGDVIAETLFLRIDRFFDSMDFLETEAYIQWKLPDGTEGASKIPYMDYETEHYRGKLILVWPLTEVITAQDGNVQFSLRFLKKSGSKTTYSWNSVPATITIKKALNPEVKYASYDDASSLFELAIENSKHTASGDVVAQPSFDKPGFITGFTITNDPTKQVVNFNTENKLLLEGQAWVAGQGRLTYEWKYANKDRSVVTTGINVQNSKANHFVETKDAAPVENKEYYIGDGSAYTEIRHAEFESKKDAGNTIYERYATYLITPETHPGNGTKDEVTGTYNLTAIHKLGFDSAETKLTAIVPGPTTLDFVSGDEVEEKGEKVRTGLVLNGNIIKDNAIDLAVKVNHDNPLGAWRSMTYLWKMTQDDPDDKSKTPSFTVVDEHIYQNEDSTNTDTLSLTGEDIKSGWYQAVVTSMLNRDKISLDSGYARVTNPPVAPDLEFPLKDGDAYRVINKNPGETAEIEINLKTNYPSPIRLHSDGLIYEWYDEDNNVITNETSGFTMDKNKLIIDGKQFAANTTLVLGCKVTNELNGLYSDSVQTGFYLVNF